MFIFFFIILLESLFSCLFFKNTTLKKPIKVEISGLRLVISNKLDQTEEEKEEVRRKMHAMKMAALESFESSVEKY